MSFTFVLYLFLLSSHNTGMANAADNCKYVNSTDTGDTDGDGVGNICDNCPSISNPSQVRIKGGLTRDSLIADITYCFLLQCRIQ